MMVIHRKNITLNDLYHLKISKCSFPNVSSTDKADDYTIDELDKTVIDFTRFTTWR